MEPIHISYNELEIDGNNIFTADISQENEAENVLFDKNKEYAVTGMTIIPKIVDSELVKVINTKELQRISEEIQEKIKNYKEPNLNLTISNPETKTLVIPFTKKTETECPRIKITFFNTTTKKNENFLVYDYYKHLKDFGFEWENKKLEFKYTITLSSDEKKLTKK